VGVLEQLKDGFNYARNFAPIREMLTFITLIGFLSMPLAVLLPAIAKNVLHGNAMTLGLLSGMQSAGALLGGVLLMSRKQTKSLGGWVLIGGIIFGVALVAFGLSHVLLLLSLLVLALAGFGCVILLAGCITLVQTLVAEEKRGRVMGFVVMSYKGIGPIGGLLAGALASFAGAGNIIIYSGVLTVLTMILFATSLLRSGTHAVSKRNSAEIA
jgi:MFS family permease